MKTTRRRLLGMIGLGAAAAALAPSVGQAASEPRVNDGHWTDAYVQSISPVQEDIAFTGTTNTLTVISGTTTLTGDVTITTTGLTIKNAEGFPAAFSYGPQTFETVTESGFDDAIAQARADGYNRGREVESAAWEARLSSDAPFIEPFSVKWASGAVSSLPLWTKS